MGIPVVGRGSVSVASAVVAPAIVSIAHRSFYRLEPYSSLIAYAHKTLVCAYVCVRYVSFFPPLVRKHFFYPLSLSYIALFSLRFSLIYHLGHIVEIHTETLRGWMGGIENMVNLCLQPPTVNPSSFWERETERMRGLPIFFVSPPCFIPLFYLVSSIWSCLIFISVVPGVSSVRHAACSASPVSCQQSQ